MKKSELLEIVNQCKLTEESLLQIESETNTIQNEEEVPTRILKMVIDLIKLEDALDDETLAGIEDVLQNLQDTEDQIQAIQKSTDDALDKAKIDLEDKAKEVEEEMAYVDQVVDTAVQMD